TLPRTFQAAGWHKDKDDIHSPLCDQTIEQTVNRSRKDLDKAQNKADEKAVKDVINITKLYSTIKKTNLQTFSSLGKEATNKGSKEQLVAMKNSNILFAKMLLIAKSRNLQLDDVFKYSLRPFPCSLATSEGDPVKTHKSKLVHAIEEEAPSLSVSDRPLEDSACIRVAMAILQTLTKL
ncbi:Hypothetical predicted protein, partial [Paramuricea clavata]